VGGAGEERLRRAFRRVVAQDVAAGWESAWRAHHRPVQVGPLWVGPSWEDPAPGALAVVIDPGQAFGTGAHPTTRLCLELLLGLAPASVVDLGCGSGVLAIAAARLGCTPVTAVDCEAAAIEATALNASANGVSIEVVEADVSSVRLPAAAVAVANLELALVETVAARLPGSVLLASGYLEADEPSPPGWKRRERRVLDGWAADLFERELSQRPGPTWAPGRQETATPKL
jgi:ribosomal protein L11 methyltransferase